MTGSSKLTAEQQDYYANRFGERYVAVQEQPLRPSRRVRRAKNGKRHTLTNTDIAVYDSQRDALRKLSDMQIRPL